MELVSVITVCLNAKEMLEKTIKSVINQNVDYIEFIVCDGGSNDGTTDFVANMFRSYDGKKILKYVEQEDNGIYDAMNKAVKYANGEWVIFLNAGDVFASSDVISCFLDTNKENVDIVYGNTKLSNDDIWRNVHINRIKYEVVFCHQSVFIRRLLQQTQGFNLLYKYAADYELFLRLYLEGYIFMHFDKIVSIYEANGASAINKEIVCREYVDIKKKYKVYLGSAIYKFVRKIYKVLYK